MKASLRLQALLVTEEAYKRVVEGPALKILQFLQTAGTLPATQPGNGNVLAALHAMLPRDLLIQWSAASYAHHFNRAEIDELTTFFQGPLGDRLVFLESIESGELEGQVRQLFMSRGPRLLAERMGMPPGEITTPPAPATAPPASDPRYGAVSKILRLLITPRDHRELLRQLIDSSAQLAGQSYGPDMAAELKPHYKAIIPAALPYEDVLNLYARAYLKELSHEEVRGLAAFFDTPTGKKFAGTSRAITAEIGKKMRAHLEAQSRRMKAGASAQLKEAAEPIQVYRRFRELIENAAYGEAAGLLDDNARSELRTIVESAASAMGLTREMLSMLPGGKLSDEQLLSVLPARHERYSITDARVDGDSALIRVRNAHGAPATIQLMRSGSTWLIHTIGAVVVAPGPPPGIYPSAP